MKKFIFIFSFICVASCTQELEPEKNIENSNTENVFIQEPKRRAGDGLDDVLGQGYDVTREYANANSAKSQIIDIAKFKTLIPNDYYLEYPYSQNYIENFGVDASDYSVKLTNKVLADVSIGLFSGNLDYSGTNNNIFESKYIYGSYDLVIKNKRIRLDYLQPTDFVNYLTPTFSTNLSLITATNVNSFVQMYGTHVLTDIYTGARLDALFRSQTTNTNKIIAATSLAKATYKDFFNKDFTNSSTITENAQNFDKRISYRTRGGNPALALFGDVNLSTNTTPINFTNWKNSVLPENSVFVDFGDSGLIPIYDLITNPTTKTLVKNAINAYLANRKANLIYPPPPPANVATFFQHPNSGGYAISLPVGEYTQEQLLAKGINNDDLSCMNVSSGYEVELYAHTFANLDSYLTKGAGYYSSFSNFGYDNVVSAIKIKSAGPTVAIVYQHGNLGGYGVGLPVGNFTLNQLRSRGMFNDDISSSRLLVGYEIRMFEHDNFSGRYLYYWCGVPTWYDVPNFNLYNFNDVTTSIQVLPKVF